jgi:hypothetical protein
MSRDGLWVGQVTLHTPVLVAQVFETCLLTPACGDDCGPGVFNRIVPDELRTLKPPMNKGDLNDQIACATASWGGKQRFKFAVDIKMLGFEYATISGVTIYVMIDGA